MHTCTFWHIQIDCEFHAYSILNYVNGIFFSQNNTVNTILIKFASCSANSIVHYLALTITSSWKVTPVKIQSSPISIRFLHKHEFGSRRFRQMLRSRIGRCPKSRRCKKSLHELTYCEWKLPFIPFQLIASRFWKSKSVKQKLSDIDLVTETDQEVEKLLINTLSAEFPHHRLV